MNSVEKELINHIIDNLDYYNETSIDDLHHNLFNQQLYVTYYSECEKWIKKHDLSVFDMNREIQQYETEQFGELYTDLGSSEKVVSMYAYILGEEILYNLDSFQKYSNTELTEEIIEEMKEELNELL